MGSQTFDFTGTGGHPLSGRLESPETAATGWAIFAHCFTCGKDSLAATRVTRALAARGVGVLRFDFAGLGSSGGRFADFAGDVGDICAAAQAMDAAGMPPSLLVGHSLGGAAVLAAAGHLPAIRAVATIGAPADLKHLLHQFDPEGLAAIAANGEAEVHLGGRPFAVRQGFIDELAAHDLQASIAQLRRPLLILHSPRDETVGIENAGRLYGAAKHPKSFISLDGADHLLTKRDDADFAATMIAAWSARYLALANAPPAA